MTTARFLVGDVFDRMAGLEDGSFDLILCSPPFLALRSYLPDGHPDKDKEIGSEATPAEFLDTLLALTAEWGRLLAPHGSLAIELGDTYAGSGGAGGDYNPGGFRDGQQAFDGSAHRQRGSDDPVERRDNEQPSLGPRKRVMGNREHRPPGHPKRGGITEGNTVSHTVPLNGGAGWPLDKSLCFLPSLYGASLAYGRNLLTGQPSPAGMWRVRNLKPWIRSNPPVGALGDKERPATSYVVVACRARDRWFDLDSVRTASGAAHSPNSVSPITGARRDDGQRFATGNHPAGAPPRDWWHHVDAVIDACIDNMAGKKPGGGPGAPRHRNSADGNDTLPHINEGGATVGARGVHIRRALEAAGILTTLDAYDISPTGYSGAHYACWPKELVRLLIDEMAPRRVCVTCGQPSRRIVNAVAMLDGQPLSRSVDASARDKGAAHGFNHNRLSTDRRTLGWSDCGHDDWRPGRILDPFVGSGTTLEVATGMGRDAVGIDIDERNVELARQRVGMFLDIDEPREAAS